jgi:Fic family protein
MTNEKKVKLTIKKIGGNKYLYIRDSIYLNKNKIIQKYKSLGRLNRSLNIVKEIATFEEMIKEEEVKTRTDYWEKKILGNKVCEYISIEEMERLRADLYRGKERLSFIANHLMETAFATDFVYNSNKIEGSRIPKTTVQKKIEEGDKGNNEVANTAKALDFFDGIKLPCTLRYLAKGQRILLGHEKSKQGVRREKMIVGNSEVIPFEKIGEEFSDLMSWYEENNYKLYPPELAFIFHYKFERIHPFKDGNGRIGRILMNEILKKHRYHPIIVWNKNRQAYFSAFEKLMEGRNIPLLKFMFEQYKNTYSIYIEKLTKAIKAEEQIGEFFKPSYE